MPRPIRRASTGNGRDIDPGTVDTAALSPVGVPADAGSLGQSPSEPEKAPASPDGDQAKEEQPRRFDSALADAEIKAEARAEPKRRKRRVKQIAPATVQDYGPLLRPIFSLASSLMDSRGIKPLSPEEIEGGVAAFTPLAAQYLPQLEGKAVWIAPVLWTSGVVLSRMGQKRVES